MPTWGVHLAIANRLIKKLKVIQTEEQKNEFIFANVMTDINNGYVVKGIRKMIPHRVTHFELKEYKGNYGEKPGYKNFYEEYKEDMDNLIVLGCYIHLMTDFYFNNITYTEYAKVNHEIDEAVVKLNTGKIIKTNMNKCRIMKQDDFKLFAYYLYKNEKIDIPKYNIEMLDKIKIIKEYEILDEDIKKTVKYIDDCVKNPKMILDTANNTQYKIFTEKELLKRLDLCIEFIMENLRQTKLQID